MEVVDFIVAMQVAIQPYEVSQHVDKKVSYVSLPYSKKEAINDNVYVYVEVLKVDFRNSFVHEEVIIVQKEVVIEIDIING